MRKLTTFALMFLVNIGILLTLTVILHLFGLNHYVTASGYSLQSLAIFCLVFGMGGAFVSLLLSKTIVKWSMRIQLVDGSDPRPAARRVHELVRRLAERAGLPKTPEVGIYESPEVNAFATGPSRSNSLVAVSTGLLAAMDEEALEGVLGHEVAHIANGDMVRMTLLQGVVNALIMFVARILASIITSRFEERAQRSTQFLIVFVLEMVLGIAGVVIVNWYSRRREFRADAGGASVAGRQKMVAALEALQARARFVDPNQAQLATLKIFGKQGFTAFFSTHPPLEQRIKALRAGSYAASF